MHWTSGKGRVPLLLNSSLLRIQDSQRQRLPPPLLVVPVHSACQLYLLSRLNSCTMDTQQPSQGNTEEAQLFSQALSDEDVSAKGNVVFSGLDERVKFVTINKVPTGKQVLRILSSIWQLKPPTLVISIHGSYANLKKRFAFTMKKGLWKTMESAGCWIIGDALDRGVGKIAGEAVAEFVEAYGGDEMLAIGVTPMHSLKFKHIFNTNAPTIYYPVEEDETVSDPTMTLVQKYRAKRFHLDKNYSHLIMVSLQTGPIKQKKQNEPGGNKQEQLAVRSEQLIQTRVAAERIVIGWRTTANRSSGENVAKEKLQSSTAASSESTHGTAPTLSETSPGLPPKQPKFRASIEPPSPPSISQHPTKASLKSEETTTQGTGLLTPVKTHSTDRKEEGPTNVSASAERRLSFRMSRLSVSSPTPSPLPKPIESETVKSTFEKEPVALQIPVCGILAGGDRWSLQQVYASMTINHCPFVVIRGSGGAASIISSVVDLNTFISNLVEEMPEDEINYKIASILEETDEQDLGAFYLRDRKPVEQPVVKSPRLSSSDATPRASHRSSLQPASPQIPNQSRTTHLNLSDYMDEVRILREIVEEHNHLISVFDMDESDMDGYVISALLSSAGLGTPLNVLNTEQLEVTIRLNRADIAKEKIFTEGRHWKRHGLDNFMFDAILNEQEAFVSLFVENGFDLEAFLTVHTLEKLYTAGMLKKDSKLETIRQIWETCRIYKMDWVMLRDVGRVVKYLLGEFYRPYYLSKHFRNIIKRAVTQHEAEEKEIPIRENPWISKKGSYFAPISPRTTETQNSSDEVRSPTPRPSATTTVNKLSHISTAKNHVSALSNGKASGTIMISNGKNRKLGVVVPVENGTSLYPEEQRWGYENANGLAVRRFGTNKGRQMNADEKSIWSQAPVVKEEDFAVKSRISRKHRKSKKTSKGHYNTAYQRSRSEMSSLNEKGSTETTEGSETKRSDEQEEVKVDNEGQNDGDAYPADVGLSTAADPSSTISMDDTFSATRKSSFAGRHRGHHQVAVGKLSAAERSRLISVEARRREAVKAEERERKRTHRLAQDKRTLYERILGIHNQRMEQCVPEQLASFAAMEKVRLERPARELMLLCILLGKLKLAVLFWGYEKEPIGGAMFCTLILGKLASICTDISQKVEFERYARIFESKAEEVLEACYAEDNQRAKMLLYRKLQEYGQSAVIRLAARGGCIHFMSHPCCQDFLSEVWMGKLSSKTTTFQLICGSMVGLVCPFILPQVMRYARDDAQSTLLRIDESSSSTTDEDDSGKDDAAYSGNLDYSVVRRKNFKPQPNLLTSPRRWLHRQIKDITQFYHAPVTRFIYNTVFYAAFLLLFSSMILRNLAVSFTIQEGLTSIMVVALLLEELKQAFDPRASLKEYFSDGWNQLDCIAIALYLGGFILRTLAYVQVRDVDLAEAKRQVIEENATCSYINPPLLVNTSNLPAATALIAHLDLQEQSAGLSEWRKRCVENLTVDNPYFLLVEERFTLARIMFALSLFAFFVRLMYIFSFSIVLGPKLIMMNRMVVNDLLPFLLLLVVIQAGYGVCSFAISYPNAYYTHYSPSTLTRNMTMKRMSAGKIVYEFFMTAYFQMFGNFGLDVLAGEDDGCRDGNLCPQVSSRRLSIVTLSCFILLTQLLMLNLLVATFTSTYYEIEGSSTYFWSYQRYEMIQEFVDRPSVAPPFTLLWYCGEVVYAAFQRFLGLQLQRPGLDDFETEITDDPFCRNLGGNYSLKSKLMKWEFMRAQNVLRSQADSDLPVSRRNEAARSTIITMRGLKGPGGGIGGRGGSGGANDKRGSVMLGGDDLPTSLFGPDCDFIEDKFTALRAQAEKVANFEDRLERIVGMMKRITLGLKKVQKSADQTINFLDGPETGRLVGARKSATPRSGTGAMPRSGFTPRADPAPSRIISNAIREAVINLSSHCLDIEEKIEEKVRIESLCVKAVLTNPDASEIPPDTVMIPPATQPGPPSRRPEAMTPSASIYERLIYSHRLWRLVPFNFERRPGMRVNIPDEMVDWKVPYPEYRPFFSNTERIAYPYPEVEDGPQIDPTKLQYNSYDEVQGVSRSCLRGRVHISKDPSGPRGLPLNPRGRSGLLWKGMLPHWGPNHAIVLAFTRAGASPNDFQVAVLDRDQCSCLPWFFVDHRESCDYRSCSAKVMRDFLLQRVANVFDSAKSENEAIKNALINSINEMEIALISDDVLGDQLDADHAWIEAVCVNFHSKGDTAFHTDAVKLFRENPPIESARWFDFKGPINLRSSHEPLLMRLLQHHGKL